MSTNVELKLTFKDAATAGLTKAAATAEKLQNKQLQNTQKSNTNAVNSYQKLHFQTVATFEKTARARETLGVRSEHVIRREIQQTREAYEQLKRSGMSSANDISRAYEAQRRKVRELRNELGELTKTQKAMNAGKFGLSAAAGVAAGAYVMKAPLMEAMNFDERLSKTTNTFYAGKSIADKTAGRTQLEKLINYTVQKNVGGGTREQAAEALGLLAEGGGFISTPDMAKKYLPTIMKTSTANMADPADITRLVISLVNQGVVRNETELKTALNMIAAGDQAGGVGIKDLAKGLPGQIGVGKAGGIVGLSGLRKLIGLNEAAMLTAGSPDIAMNNVLNLLTKVASSDTAKDFAKAGRGDLGKVLLNERARGTDAVDIWNKLIDTEVSKNPQGKKLLAQLENAKSSKERDEAIEGVNQLLEGNVIGTYFQDMQARSALLGMRNKSFMASADKTIATNMNPYGINDTNFEFMQTTASADVRAAQQAKDAGVKAAMDGLTPTVGKLSEQFADLATKHPALAGTSVLAATGLTAVATASGVAAISMGGIGGMSGAIAAAAGGFSTLANVVPLAAAAFAGFQVGDKVINPLINKGVQTLTGNENASLGTWIADVVNSDQLKQIDRNMGKVETTVRVELADGLKAKTQTTNTAGPVKTWMKTGSIWGTP